jgi:hypothetical protein
MTVEGEIRQLADGSEMDVHSPEFSALAALICGLNFNRRIHIEIQGNFFQRVVLPSEELLSWDSLVVASCVSELGRVWIHSASGHEISSAFQCFTHAIRHIQDEQAEILSVYEFLDDEFVHFFDEHDKKKVLRDNRKHAVVKYKGDAVFHPLASISKIDFLLDDAEKRPLAVSRRELHSNYFGEIHGVDDTSRARDKVRLIFLIFYLLLNPCFS